MSSLLRGLGLALCLTVSASGVSASELNKVIAPPVLDAAPAAGTQTIVLAAGCFWGIQGVYQHVKGVTRVLAGYAGGSKETATYDQVTTETTGHAESVEIQFDPKQVSLGRLLQIYFSVAHDPTELNRQGPDEGPSYRSAIFFSNTEQQKVARAYIDQLNKAKIFSRPIATTLEPLKGFYMAEGYHQDYLIGHPTQPYIVYNDLPKIAALKRVYPEVYRDQPVRVPAALLRK
jgi:peptide-methionine (S)-S-oxide reductase